MIVINKRLLKEFSTPGICECGCGIWCVSRDPNHILLRGVGGGSRLDVRENLLSLRREPCHNQFHDCRPNAPGHRDQRKRFCDIVAIREGFASGEAVWDWLNMLLGLPKYSEIPERIRT